MKNGIIPAAFADKIHGLLRIMSGLLFLAHGLTKLIHWPATNYFPPDQPLPTMMLFVGILETVGGLLITVGAFTRYAAFLCSGLMAAAYFMAHSGASIFPIQNGGELAIMFCFVFLFFASAGAGAFSVDNRK